MNAFKVLHGNPSDEELAAVVAVLLSAGQQQESAAESGDGTNGPARTASWSRGSRAYAAPAASWKFFS
ncbi:acyl-CoA carboxylase subunit epsilon [Streptomyces sp. NPDC020898]|uniref:acyl-CoA carboxylase subunit epsilon n=1 Tax=Streptomyces sp. NPDC020898 TaxID=3365101 RepID=UPI0037A48DCB